MLSVVLVLVLLTSGAGALLELEYLTRRDVDGRRS